MDAEQLHQYLHYFLCHHFGHKQVDPTYKYESQTLRQFLTSIYLQENQGHHHENEVFQYLFLDNVWKPECWTWHGGKKTVSISGWPLGGHPLNRRDQEPFLQNTINQWITETKIRLHFNNLSSRPLNFIPAQFQGRKRNYSKKNVVQNEPSHEACNKHEADSTPSRTRRMSHSSDVI